MPGNLTSRQFEALRAIEEFIGENKVAPTLEELCLDLKVTSNQAVINYLNILEKKGYIKREKKARGIRLLRQSSKLGEKNLLVNILSGIADRKDATGFRKTKIRYSNPYAVDETPSKIISWSYK